MLRYKNGAPRSQWSQLTGINSWQNGFRFTVYSGVDNSFSGVGSDRADFTGSNISQAILGDRSHGQMVNQYFNTSLFTVNAIGTYGNAARNLLANPGLFNIWRLSSTSRLTSE